MDIPSNSATLENKDTLTFDSFRETYQVSKEAFCREVFLENRDSIQIKKERTVVKNLARIFEATFRICSRKGFRGMSMRDLSQESGLSMGGLYAYFRSKDELLNTLQRVGNRFVQQILQEACKKHVGTYHKLRTIVKIHLYLSEIVQAWFFFSYMEAKSMSKQERDFYKDAELSTESLIHDILEQGAEEGVFMQRNHLLAASVIKAMLQDWYLKRWKYSKRDIKVDQYAEFVLGFIESYYLEKQPYPDFK
ncbi:MAG: TetR/AcrR family transcriptional regulator [Proteobacteria bacterium]|nr:TetR/AcrR family transcriptional regulator [Pseudomonadota bacterium]